VLSEGVTRREWAGLEMRIIKMFSMSGKQDSYHHHWIWCVTLCSIFVSMDIACRRWPGHIRK
jgi:hypothetical protein